MRPCSSSSGSSDIFARCIRRLLRRAGDVKLKNHCIPTAKNPEQPGSASKDGGDGGRVTVFVCQQRSGGGGGAHTQFARRVGVAHATQSAPLDIAQTHAADP
jgi:hypothetical protein